MNNYADNAWRESAPGYAKDDLRLAARRRGWSLGVEVHCQYPRCDLQLMALSWDLMTMRES